MNKPGRKKKTKALSSAAIFWILGVAMIILALPVIVFFQAEKPSPVHNVSPTSTANSPSSSTIAVQVWGEPVDVREFLLFLQQNRASVFDYFHHTYGATDSNTFWTNNYGGEIPADKLKQVTLTSIVQTTVQQHLAKEYGIISDISYDGFIQAFMQENLRRQNAFTHHQIIYGPTYYNEWDYFTYRFSNMVIQLKYVLDQKLFMTSDQKLQAYYNQMKDPWYKDQTNSTYRPFSTVKNMVREKYMNDQYNILIDQLVKKATVTVNTRIYNQITIA